MPTPLIIELIQTLSPNEQKEFVGFLAWRSSGTTLLNLWETLSHSANSPSTDIKETRARKAAASRLLVILKDFLAWKAISNDNSMKQRLLLQAMEGRSAPRNIQVNLNRLKKATFVNGNIQDMEAAIFLAMQKTKFSRQLQPRNISADLMPLSDLYEQRFVIDRLYQHFVQSQSAYVFGHASPKLPKYFQQMVKNFQRDPIVGLLQLLIGALRNRSPKRLVRIAAALWDLHSRLSEDLAADTLNFLINSAVVHENTSRGGSIVSLYLLYQWGFETGVLARRGRVRLSVFKNYLHICLRLNQWETANDLVKRFGALQPEFIRLYATAQIAFYRGDFLRVQSHLKSLQSMEASLAKDIYIKAAVQSLLIKTEYVLAWESQHNDSSLIDWVPLLRRVESHIAFLKSQGKLKPDLLETMVNRMVLVRKLIKARTNDALRQIRNEIITVSRPVDYTPWLLYHVEKRLERQKATRK